MRKSSKPLFCIGFGLGAIGVGINTVMAYASLFHVSLVSNANQPRVVIGFTAIATLGLWLLAIGGGYMRIRRYVHGR